MAFVIDASAKLPWCFEDEATPGTDRLLFDLAHELCHLRHGDHIATAVHMAVEAVFWFYP